MRYYRCAGIAVLALAAAIFTFIKVANPTPPPPISVAAQLPAPEESVVLVNVSGGGHGSGVHIGRGFVITAAHVADGTKAIALKATNGAEMPADVLWVSKDYDIALLRTAGALPGEVALDCRDVKLGDDIQAAGNPLNLEFVSSFGRVAGLNRKMGPWKQIFVTDITTVMGQSGGPVFGNDGRVVGIAVGVAMAALPDASGVYAPSLTGFGMAVPASAVCALMGRVV